MCNVYINAAAVAVVVVVAAVNQPAASWELKIKVIILQQFSVMVNAAAVRSVKPRGAVVCANVKFLVAQRW